MLDDLPVPSPTNTTRQGSSPTGEPAAKRRQQPKPLQLCRSCLRCRSRKVRCSGDRPTCTTCAAVDYPCSYREDARRTAGTVKGEVHNLQKEISQLRQLIQEHRHGSVPVPPPVVSPRTPSDARSQHSSLDINLTGHLFDGAGGLTATDPLPKGLPEADAQSTPQRTPQRTPQQEPGRDRQSPNGPLPSEANIAGAFSDNGHVQVHGVTSTLHQQSGCSDENSVNDKQAEVDEVSRHRLISYAAIQRQKENFIFGSLSLDTKVDLDGLAPEMAKHLLDIHWNRQHFTYLLTYRPAIMESLINGGPYANKLLLNAIYYTSCQYSDRISLRSDLNDPQTIGARFYRRFKELLVDHIDQPSIPTSIALLLCGQCLVAYGKQSGGWVLCGAAYRMIIELGCHLSIEDRRVKHQDAVPSTLIDSEVRKRLYWGAFVIDKFQSLYLGRAPALRPSEARVSKELLDTYEEHESWTPYVDVESGGFDRGLSAYLPRLAHGVSSFKALLGLSEIATNLMEAFYSMESVKLQREAALQKRAEILQELDDWQASIPSHLQYIAEDDSCPPPHQLNTQTTYWTLVILNGRPFLSNGHLGSFMDTASQAAIEEQCAAAALKIWGLVKTYRDTFTLKRAPYIMCYAAYHAVLVLLYSRQTQVHFPDCIPYLWSALGDLKRGCHGGLTKPLQILKQRLSENTIVALADGPEAIQGLPSNGYGVQNGGGDINENTHGIANADFLQSLDIDAWNTPSWLDRVVGDQLLQDESAMGLTGTFSQQYPELHLLGCGQNT